MPSIPLSTFLVLSCLVPPQDVPWDHNDIAIFKSSTGYFIDDHPASHWLNTFSRIWGIRGWQLVLSATMSLDIWNQCQQYEDALRQEEERIAVNKPNFPLSSNLMTIQFPVEV